MTSSLDTWKHARALAILKLIADLGRPAMLKELVAITSGDDETISRYCSLLASLGYLTRISAHSGWALTPQGLSFLTPNPGASCVIPSAKLSTAPVDNSAPSPSAVPARPPAEDHTSQTSGDYPVEALKNPLSPLEYPENSPFLLTYTQTKREELSKKESQKIGFSDENFRFFEQIGVLVNRRTEFLARQVHPQVMRAEWKKLQDKNKAWPGLLIKTLASLPLPAHPRSCACPACLARLAERDRQQRRRYAQWNT